MGKWAVFFAAAAAMLAGCAPGDHCSQGYDCAKPDPCQGPTGGSYHCEGETLVYAGTTCGAPADSRTDCTATGAVCVAGQDACLVPCVDDAGCGADEYCAPLAASDQSASAKAVCKARLAKDADCTDSPAACATGLVCDAQAGAPDKKACRADCATADPTAPRCPDGATMACIGTKAYRCDECGVAVSVDRDCATAPDGANACVVSSDQAFCVVSTTPDPRCANVDAYCDGEVLVDCFQGYEQARADCAPMQCLESGGRCG